MRFCNSTFFQRVSVLFKITSALFLLLTFLVKANAQQSVFNRSDANTGNWGSGNLPWFYQSSNNNQGDPDNGNTTRNDVFIGHNNNLTMSLNGRFYLHRDFTFQAGASSSRFLGNTAGGGFSFTRSLINASSVTHTFGTPVGIDATNAEIRLDNASGGGLTFSGSVFTNSNQTFIRFFNNNAGTITFSGPMTQGGSFVKQNEGTLVFNGSADFSGNIFIDEGIVRAGRNLSSNTIEIGGGVAASTAFNAQLEIGNGGTLVSKNIIVKNFNSQGGGRSIWFTHPSSTTATISGNISLETGIGLQIGNPGPNDGAIISGVISGAGDIIKEQTGVLILTGANTYTGSTVINMGELRFNPTTNITPSSPITLNGGTLSTTGIAPGRTITSSSTLQLLGDAFLTNSTITLGSGNHTLSFANSSGVSWSPARRLTINGWVGGYNGTEASASNPKLFIGNSASGLTPTQLSQIRFFDGTNYFPAILLSTGELVPTTNSITIGSITGTSFCTESSVINIPFTYILPNPLTGSATFIAQLSDANGSFSESVNALGAVSSDGSRSQSISATIPFGVEPGSSYRIRISCSSPETESSDNGTDLTINVTPEQPTVTAGGATTFCNGGTVIFTSSSATGNQWYKDGNLIVGAINQTYVAITSGVYTVIVTNNGCASLASSGTTIIVNSAPALDNRTIGIDCNATANLNDGLSIDPDGLIIRFYSDATALNEIPAEVNSPGNYYVVAINTFGCSDTAQITVTQNPDEQAPVIVCDPAGIGLTVNLDSNCQILTPNHIQFVSQFATDNCTPTSSLIFTQSPAPGTLVTTTVGNRFLLTVTATDLAGNSRQCSLFINARDNTNPVIQTCATPQSATANQSNQATVPDFTSSVVASDPCSGSVTVTQLPIAGSIVSTGVTTITITATDLSGNTATCTSTFTVNAACDAPAITVQPATTNAICTGGNILLSVTATGTNLHYQWKKDGTGVGSDQNSYSATAAGIYTVVITGDCGTVTSNDAVVIVNATSSSSQSRTICSNKLPYTWDGLTFTEAGTQTKTGLTNAAGCDSTATYILTVNATTSSTQSRTICSNELPYSWDGLTFTEAGTQTKTGLTNAAGCDSIATYNLTVTTAVTWYLDADNDGYYLSSVQACSSPGANYRTTGTALGDCNDNDANVYLTAPTGLAATGGVGTITASATGATEYSVNGTTYQPTGNFSGLAAGTYTVYARNTVNGCVATITGIVVTGTGPCTPITPPVTPTPTINYLNVCHIIGTSTTARVTTTVPGNTVAYRWKLPAGVVCVSAFTSIVGQDSIETTVNFIDIRFESGFVPNSTISVRSRSACNILSTTAKTVTLKAASPAAPTIRSWNGSADITAIINPCPFYTDVNDIESDIVQYTVRLDSIVTGYTWSVSNTSTMIIVGNPNDSIVSVKFTSAFVSGVLTITKSSGCGSYSKTLTIKKLAAAKPGALRTFRNGTTLIAPYVNVCDVVGSATEFVRYQLSSIPLYSTSYIWSVSNLTTMQVVGGGTASDNFIDVRFLTGFTFGQVIVQSVNSCSVSAATILTVKTTIPIFPALTVINTTVPTGGTLCGATNVILTTSAIATDSTTNDYVWTLPTGVTPNVSIAATLIGPGIGGTNYSTSSNSIAIDWNSTKAGKIVVAGRSNCGIGKAISLTLVATPAKPGVITEVQNCPSQFNYTYTIPSIPGAVTYTWKVPVGVTIVSGQGTTTLNVNYRTTPAVNGSVSVAATNACGTSLSSSIIKTAFTPPVCAGPVSRPGSGIVDGTSATVEMGAKVIPNPNNGSFVLRIQTANVKDAAQIQVLDIQGRVVLNLVGVNNNGIIQTGININQLIPNGNYLVKYIIGKETGTVKMMIQR